MSKVKEGKMANKKTNSSKKLTMRQPRRRQQVPATWFDNVFGQTFLPEGWGGFASDDAVWVPAINVQEKEDKFVAKVELFDSYKI